MGVEEAGTPDPRADVEKHTGDIINQGLLRPKVLGTLGTERQVRILFHRYRDNVARAQQEQGVDPVDLGHS